MKRTPEMKEKWYDIRFETNLNASMCIVIFAKNKQDAIRKLKKEYPSAFNIEVG